MIVSRNSRSARSFFQGSSCSRSTLCYVYLPRHPSSRCSRVKGKDGKSVHGSSLRTADEPLNFRTALPFYLSSRCIMASSLSLSLSLSLSISLSFGSRISKGAVVIRTINPWNELTFDRASFDLFE